MKKYMGLLLITVFFNQNWCLAQDRSDKFYKKSVRLMVKKKYKRCGKNLGKALTEDPRNEKALFMRADMSMVILRPDLALADYRTIMNNNPINTEAYLLMSNTFRTMNERDSSLKYANIAISLEASNARTYLNKAHVLFEFKEFERAQKFYRKCLELDSNLLVAKEQYAFCYTETDQVDSAIFFFERLLRNDTTNSSYLINIGFCHMIREEYNLAAPYFERALEVFPEHPIAICNQAFTQYKLGNRALGWELISKSLELAPGNSYAFRYIALMHLDEQNVHKACACMNTALEMGYTRTYDKDIIKMYLEHCN